jgi:hypothetical protein
MSVITELRAKYNGTELISCILPKGNLFRRICALVAGQRERLDCFLGSTCGEAS